MSSLTHQKTAFLEVKGQIDALFSRCVQLRQGSQTILDDLLRAQVTLSQVIMKIEEISAQLSNCGYALARRGIGPKLKRIVADCQVVNRSGVVSYNAQKVERTLQDVEKLDGNTRVVLAIMDAA
jgi:hypothetical protein